MAEFTEKELKRRLSLYHVFLKLYEHNRGFLDEILQLENNFQSSLPGLQLLYLQAVVDNSAVYLITNMCDGKTQALLQPQHLWTIGRDQSSGIYIADRYVSRRHAAIQYIDGIEDKGFYLIDFSSTNGTFLNGEQIYQPRKLKDGDRIRLGSMTFSFFMNLTPPQVLPKVAVELLMQLVPRKDGTDNLEITVPTFHDVSLIESKQATISASESQLTKEQQSEILDDFFRRQASKHSSKQPTKIWQKLGDR